MQNKAVWYVGSVLALSALLVGSSFAQQVPKMAAVDLQQAFETSVEGFEPRYPDLVRLIWSDLGSV